MTLIREVTAELGAVGKVLTRADVTGAVFATLLEQVAAAVPRAALLLDNASWHHAKTALRENGHLNLLPLFNVANTQELNRIERLFSQLKARYRWRRAEAIALGIIVPTEFLILHALSDLR